MAGNPALQQAQSMLNSMMGNTASMASSMARPKSQGSTAEDPNVKATRTLLTQAYADAKKTGDMTDYNAIKEQAVQMGIPTAALDASLSVTTGEQRVNQYLSQQTAAYMQGLLTGVPVKTAVNPVFNRQDPNNPSLKAPGNLNVNPDGTLNQSPEEVVQEAKSVPQGIFNDDMMLRMAMKKFADIDIGMNYQGNQAWFKDFGDLRSQGVPVTQAINTLAATYGFIPDRATSLRDLSEQESQVLYNMTFSKYFNDPHISRLLAQTVPDAVDPKTGQIDPKVKAGLIYSTMAENGFVLPEKAQAFLDHFRGLDSPGKDVIQPDVAQYLYATRGVLPQDATPEQVNMARKEFDDEQLVNAVRQVVFTEKGKTLTGFELESQKPISSEDRAKYGIGTKFSTYTELADAGRSFPTELDRKLYSQYGDVRDKFISMESMLFGKGGMKKPSGEGIFSGIGNNIASRTKAQAALQKDRAAGNVRGQNLQIYNDNLAAFARQLLTLAGESGGRFTDKDVAQIIKGAPDPGGLFGSPDSEEVARRKFEQFTVDLGRRLSKIETTTTIGLKGQTATSSTSKYTIDKVYTDANGKKAKYLGKNEETGEDQWLPIQE